MFGAFIEDWFASYVNRRLAIGMNRHWLGRLDNEISQKMNDPSGLCRYTTHGTIFSFSRG